MTYCEFRYFINFVCSTSIILEAIIVEFGALWFSYFFVNIVIKNFVFGQTKTLQLKQLDMLLNSTVHLYFSCCLLKMQNLRDGEWNPIFIRFFGLMLINYQFIWFSNILGTCSTNFICFLYDRNC